MGLGGAGTIHCYHVGQELGGRCTLWSWAGQKPHTATMCTMGLGGAGPTHCSHVGQGTRQELYNMRAG